MAFSSLPSIKVINSFEVSPPAGSSPTHEIIPLTFFDMMMINADHVERLFFYHFPPNFNSDNFISSLRSSLSHTLKYFYPFAGKLRCSTNGNDNKFEVVYTQGDSVSFVVSECNNSRFEELASYLPRSVSHLKPLVPYLPISDESQPLLAVQVTVFPDQGIVVGTSIHHAICDGNSSMQFMHSWAATNLSGSFDSSLKPITDRTLVPDPWDLCTIISRSSNKETPPLPGPAISNDNCVATFTLNKERIERLKRFICYKAEEMKISFRCSTIVVSFAFAWMCYIKSQKEHSGTKKLAGLLVPTDFRARIEPPIPRTYFGNCIGPCLVRVDRKDFFNNHGLVLVAQAIGKTIDELTYGNKFADDIGRFSAFVRNVDLMIMGGSPRFRVYGVNFGLGKPKKVEMISVAKVGFVAVAESREEEGGVELGITLDQAEMDSFVKYFTSDLNFEI